MKFTGFFSSIKIKKGIAFLCIFSVLFPSFSLSAQSFFENLRFFPEKNLDLPLSTTTPLVSILVEESLLTDSKLIDKIERYARDVQKAINGKSILVPIPKNFSPYEIFEGNSALYFSGENQDHLSQLIGTVLIGDIPIPVVEKNETYHTTVFPYTDFEKNNYLWDKEKERFVFQTSGDEQAEIWHGVIRSDINTGNDEADSNAKKKELSSFFDRNHQFHEGDIKFPKKVFYADLLTQKKGLPDLVKQAYYKWIKNIDNVLYKRYSKQLARDLFNDQELDSVIPTKYLPTLAQSSTSTDIQFDTLPDIYSKGVIDSIIRRYFENYEGYLSQLYDQIDNSGRWTPGEIDTTITLISQKDEAVGKRLKDFNDSVETILFTEVKNQKIDRNIYIPVDKVYRKVIQKSNSSEYVTLEHERKPLYWNGVRRSEIDTAQKCSLRRGNPASSLFPYSQMISANNALDVSTRNQCPDLNAIPAPSQATIDASPYELCCAANIGYSNSSGFYNNKCVASSDWEPACQSSVLGLGNDCFLEEIEVIKTMRKGYVHQGSEMDLFNWAGSKKVSSGAIGASACPDIYFEPIYPDLVLTEACTNATIEFLNNNGSFDEVLLECKAVSDITLVKETVLDLFTAAQSDLLDQIAIIHPYTSVPSPCTNPLDIDSCSEVTVFSSFARQEAEQIVYNDLFQKYTDIKDLKENKIEKAYTDIIQANESAAETQIELDVITTSLNLQNGFTDAADLETLKEIKTQEEDDFDEVYKNTFGAITGSVYDAFDQVVSFGYANLEVLLQQVLDTVTAWEAEKERTTEVQLGDPFSSLMNHIEPTKEAIETQLAKGKESVPMYLPIDDPRGFSFYDNDPVEPKFHRIAYPDIFSLRDEFLDQSESDRRNSLLTYIDTYLLNTVTEINNTGGNTESISSNIFDSLWFGVQKEQIVDGIIWLDKTLEEKNQEIFTGILSDPERGRRVLDQPYFDGYEMIQIIGEKSKTNAGYGIKADFEQGEEAPTSYFLEAERDQLSFEFSSSLQKKISGKNNNSRDSVFENEKISNVFNQANKNETCDRNIFTWPASCFIPWLKEIPKSFEKFLILPTFFDPDSGEVLPDAIISTKSVLPETYNIQKIPEKIHISSAETLPQKIDIEIHDEGGNVLENDFSTEVTFSSEGSDFNRFFRNASPSTQKVHAGEISFFFTPKTSNFGGKFSLDFTVNGEKTISVPVTISTNTIFASLKKTTFKAGEKKEKLQIQIMDANNKSISDFDGEVLQLSSDIGSFLEDTLVIKNGGLAETHFMPSLKAGSGTIQIINEKNLFPSYQIFIDVKPNKPEKLVYQTKQNAFVLGAEPSKIKAVLADRYGNVLENSENSVSYEGEGVQFENGEKINEIFAHVAKESQSEPVSIVSKASLLETKGEERLFSVIDSPSLFFGPLEWENIKVSDSKKQSIPVYGMLSNMKKGLNIGKIRVFVETSSNSVGIFPKEIWLDNGKGALEFFPGKISGTVDIKLSAPGFESVSTSVSILPEKAHHISVSAQDGIDVNQTGDTNITIKVFDIYGNRVQDFDDSVFVRFNPPERFSDSQIQGLSDSGDFSNQARLDYLKDTLNPQSISDFYPTFIETTPPIEQQIIDEDIFYGAQVNIQNGFGSIAIKPKGKTAQLYIVAEKEGLVSGTDSLEISNTLSLQDFNILSPKSAFTLLGGFDGGTFETPNVGNRFLFSGETQAVATLLEEGDLQKTKGVIHPSGKVSSGSDIVFKSQEFFSFSVLSESKPLIEAELVFQKLPKITFDKKEAKETTGIHFFPEKLSQENNLSFSKNKVWLNETPLFEIFKNGGIRILDPRIDIVSQNNSFFEWGISFDSEKIIDLKIRFDSNVFVSKEIVEENFSQNHSSFLGSKKQKKISGILYQKIPDTYDVEEFFAGKTTNDPKGLKILSKVERETSDKKLGFSSISLEDMVENRETGWRGNWKPAIHAAAKNSIGNSVKFGASDNVVLLGDPTVVFQSENLKNDLQITEDIGKLIWKSSEGIINEIVSGDLNGDSVSEIFLRVGNTLHALYQDRKQMDNFRDTGPILRFSDGAKKVVSYTDFQENLQYLIQLNKNGELIFHMNDEGRFVRTLKNVFESKTPLLDIQVGEVNGDKYKDLVVLDQNNTIFFIHGKPENEFSSPKELYNFSPEFISIQEEHSINSSKNSFFQKKSQENLSHTYVAFSNLSEYLHADDIREIQETEYTLIVNNTLIESELEIKSSKKSLKVGDSVPAKIKLSATSDVSNFQILIPKLTGTDFDLESFSCQGCFGETDISDSSTHILVKDIIFPAQGTVIFSWDFVLRDIPPISFLLEDFSGNDGIDDIAVPWERKGEEKQFIKFISNSSLKQYPKKTRGLSASFSKETLKNVYDSLKAQLVSESNSVSQLKILEDDLFNTHTKIIDEAFPKESQNPILNGEVDLEATADEVLGALSLDTPKVETALEGMGCGGKCGLPVPSYVFNAPGTQSLYIPPFGFPGVPSLPVPFVGLAALQIIPTIPFVLPFAPALPASLFRLFVMPTTTAQVGIGLCAGPPSGFSVPPLPIGNCFVIIPPLLELGGMCPASILGQNNSPALHSLQGAFVSDSFQTGSFSPPVVSALTNKKLVSADIITEWVKRQFEEFGNFKFPHINFKFPKLPSKKPDIPDKNIIEKLENSPYIELEKKIVSIPYPDFSQEQLDTLEISWDSWKGKLNIWKCDSQNKSLNQETGKCEGEESFSVTSKKTGMAVILSLLAKKEKNNFLGEAAKTLSDQLEFPNSCEIEPQKKEKFEAAISKNIDSLKTEIQKNKSDINKTSADIQQIENPALKNLGIQLLAEVNRESNAHLEKPSSGSKKTSKQEIPGKKISEKQNISQNPQEKTHCSQISENFSQNVSKFEKLFKTLTDLSKKGEGESSFDISLKTDDFSERTKNIIDEKLKIDQIFEKFDTNANNFEQNINSLKKYKSSSKSLKEFPEKLKNVLKKTETSTSLIEEYFSVWMDTNERNIAEWENFEFELQNVLGIWSSIPEIFQGLEPICTRCNVNRGSMLEWLLRMLLGGIKLPVISLPKMADIEVDLSRIGIGFRVLVPQIKLEPVPLKTPSLPDLPDLNVSNIFYTLILAAVSNSVDFDWDSKLSPMAQEISQEFSTLLLLAMVLDMEDIDIDEIEIGPILSNVFEEQFESTIGELLSNVDTSALPEISKIPDILLLPSLPSFEEIGLNLEMPVLNLPVLPTVLPPPVIPDFLGKLKAIVSIPKPFFNMLCFFFMGYLPVPEWKVASTVQERTNRTLLLPIDFSFAALTPNTPKIAPKPKTISFEKTYIDFLKEIDQKLNEFQITSKCVVKQIGNINKGSKNAEKCISKPQSVSILLEKKEDPLITQIEKISTQKLFSDTNTIFSKKSLEDIQSNSLTQNQIAQLQNLVKDPNVLEKNSQKSQEKFFAKVSGSPPIYEKKMLAQDKIKNWVTSALDIDLSQIPTSIPGTFDQQDFMDESNQEIPFVPKIYFYDPEKDASASVTEYPLDRVSFTSLNQDLDKDQEKEILFSMNNELYLKRRYEVPKEEDAFEASSDIIWWKIEKFLGKYVPTIEYESNVDASGNIFSFTQNNGEIPYFEWIISERPDMVFEYYKEAQDRFSKIWKRIGYLVRPKFKKYQIRPSSAQIKKIHGKPVLLGSPIKKIPLFETKEVCNNENVTKPFYSKQTILVADQDKTIFNIKTKDRNGQTQKSYWKTMNSGEETLVDFAEICLISGSLKEVGITDRAYMTPKAGDYFASGMLLELGPGDEVHLELFDGRKIIIYENETYELHYFENEKEEVQKLKELDIGNYYGVFKAFKNAETGSHTRAKLLHDPQIIDDIDPPTLYLEDGQNMNIPVFEEIQIDASKSSDNRGIKTVSWTTQKEELDLSSEKDLLLNIPAQNSVQSFIIELSLTDEAGNVSKQSINITVDPPESHLTEVNKKQAQILGKIVSDKKNVPLTIFRERNGKKVVFSSVFTHEKGQFELKLQNNGRVEIWEKEFQKKVFEILPTGRPIIFDTRFSYRIKSATDKNPIQIIFSDNSLEEVAVLNIGLEEPRGISFYKENNTYSESLNKNIFVSNEEPKKWKWVSFESDLVEFKNAFALLDINKNIVIGVLNEYGSFSLSDTKNITLKLKPTFNEEEPLVFQIFSSGILSGEFSLPLEEELWTK